MGSDRPDEFDTISRLLRPLANHPAARGLMDDVAVLTPPDGRTLVLTHDAMVAGVHFWPHDPPDLIARKLLRVNLSDLAAKGAEPFGYLLSCAWAAECDWSWREAFAGGLALDQSQFGLNLLGGDTVSTPGPLTIGATLIGWGRPGRSPARSGAREGDLILVSGTIGDAGLGLRITSGEDLGLEQDDSAWLAGRYRLPEPRTALAAMMAQLATASADVSDGLAADLAHISEASALSAEVDLEAMPLSVAAGRWVAGQTDASSARACLASSGDDYEIVFTIRPEALDQVRTEAAAVGCPVTPIGVIKTGSGLVATVEGRPLEIERLGWRHR
ncbi:MAG: thiamine-phosphate kinase [Caulobacterales bacterium]|nr:thiamine-phosphate kinase [Caulobacterales bacterium]